MPKFFCDYCDVYLTHDSMSVRKAHNSGRNHLRNVIEYYQQLSQERAQSVIDAVTNSYNAEGQGHNNPMNQLTQPFGGAGGPPPGMPPFNPGAMPPMPFGAGRGGPPLPFPPPAGMPFPPPNLPAGMPFPPPPFAAGGAAGSPPAGLPFPPPPGGMPPPGAFPLGFPPQAAPGPSPPGAPAAGQFAGPPPPGMGMAMGGPPPGPHGPPGQ